MPIPQGEVFLSLQKAKACSCMEKGGATAFLLAMLPLSDGAMERVFGRMGDSHRGWLVSPPLLGGLCEKQAGGT